MIDTTSAHGKLITGILAVIGEFERSLIVTRTSEGRKRAMSNGVKFGRKPKLTPHQRKEALQRRAAGESEIAIAKTFNGF
jgi:DNA invertase Pin-like site-specific DNA recombinase